MLEKSKIDGQSSLFFSLESTLNHKHPLFLAHKVDWDIFEKAFSPLCCLDNGRPAKPIRLMVGLLILKHVRNLSDESVVEQWSENIYYQYFYGGQELFPSEPCAASELVHFRHCIGEEGIELILKESIRINGKDGEDKDVYFNTTVQEKNITFPADDKLAKKIINKCLRIADENDLTLCQTYTRTLKRLSCDQHFRNHPKNKGKARKADKKVKTIAGRHVRDEERKLGEEVPVYKEILELFKRVLVQKRNDTNKIYSLHEPEVCCISKGKEHKLYEFGNKVSKGWTAKGVIVGALGFRNEYDGHTLDKSIEQVERVRERAPENGIGDRGYRGRSKVRTTIIHIPKPFSRNLSAYMQRKEKKYFRKHAVIESVIGHLKADHRLSRDFYKGIFGDNINILLAAAGFNFRRRMNKWKASFLTCLEQVFRVIIMIPNLVAIDNNSRNNSK
mgnify:CR=1 FL=1|jgi:IS5 family transposase